VNTLAPLICPSCGAELDGWLSESCGACGMELSVDAFCRSMAEIESVTPDCSQLLLDLPAGPACGAT
jgi:predicted amidophosphoribosyltransferase